VFIVLASMITTVAACFFLDLLAHYIPMILLSVGVAVSLVAAAGISFAIGGTPVDK
jgi:hypothetical protein